MLTPPLLSRLGLAGGIKRSFVHQWHWLLVLVLPTMTKRQPSSSTPVGVCTPYACERVVGCAMMIDGGVWAGTAVLPCRHLLLLPPQQPELHGWEVNWRAVCERVRVCDVCSSDGVGVCACTHTPVSGGTDKTSDSGRF